MVERAAVDSPRITVMPETVPAWAYLALIVAAFAMSAVSLVLSFVTSRRNDGSAESHIARGGGMSATTGARSFTSSPDDAARHADVCWELQWLRPFPFPATQLAILDLPVVIRNNGTGSAHGVRVELSCGDDIIAEERFDVIAGRVNEFFIPFRHSDSAQRNGLQVSLLHSRAAIAQLSTCTAKITWVSDTGSTERTEYALTPIDAFS